MCSTFNFVQKDQFPVILQLMESNKSYLRYKDYIKFFETI
jgi:hypothetical protein